jgi:hypothetical protein
VQRTEAAARMNSLLKSTRGPGEVDAVMALSGGKDSSWTLYELSRTTELRVLAVTVDNGYLSEVALRNARLISERAGARHEVLRPSIEDMRRLFHAAVVDDLHPETHQGRASGICNACISVIKLHCLAVARREHAPFMIWGWSPGQAPLSSALYRPTSSMIDVFVDQQIGPLHKVFPEGRDWIERPQFSSDDEVPRFVHPLAVWDYDEKRILGRLRELGWTQPDDVDSTSTNCRLNALGVAIHQRRHGYHPYAHELAGLVRNRILSRAESLRRQQQQEITPEILEITRELDLSPEIFD